MIILIGAKQTTKSREFNPCLVIVRKTVGFSWQSKTRESKIRFTPLKFYYIPKSNPIRIANLIARAG